MASWYECKFKYNRENQDGGFTTISETYLVDAVSFTDAESRIYGEIGANYRDFILLKVAKYPVHELIPNEEGEKWYKCKVALITFDEKTEKEKKQKQNVIVNGSSVKEAYERIEEAFRGSTSDYEIVDIVTTAIIEVLPYVEEGERKLRKLEPGTIHTNELVSAENLSEN
jgi:hypothetical protein